jgi:threonine synthase
MSNRRSVRSILYTKCRGRAVEYVKAYRCSGCGLELNPYSPETRCPNDHGNLDVLLDTERLRRRLTPREIACRSDRSIWRYSELLPVPIPDSQGPIRGVGGTPLYLSRELSDRYDLRGVWFKDDSRMAAHRVPSALSPSAIPMAASAPPAHAAASAPRPAAATPAAALPAPEAEHATPNPTSQS